MQDGIDLIDAVARHPATGPRLARKLYGFFMNETDAPDAALLQDMSRIYYDSGFEIKPMLLPAADLGAVPRRAQLVQAVFVAGRVRRRAR